MWRKLILFQSASEELPGGDNEAGARPTPCETLV